MQTSIWAIGLRVGSVVTWGILFASCGGGGSDSGAGSTGAASNQRGTLVNWSLAKTLTPNQYTAGLNSDANGQLALSVAGPPTCTINIYHIEYWTVAPSPPGGGTEAPTLVSGAVIVPTGAAVQCSGSRPILLEAHGFQTDPTYNMADVDPTTSDIGERELVPLFFATQGYIVVAPNYAGYDISSLGYWPFLNAEQNAKEMEDALTAASQALSGPLASATTDSGKLFTCGYSAGGFVIMAADKAMQAAGIAITATAPTSGVYPVEAWRDAAFTGGLAFSDGMAFLTTSYQNAYGNVYSSLSDVYTAAYLADITSILPSQTVNLLPLAVFNGTPPSTGNPQLDALLQPTTADPIIATEFGNPYLITDGYRQSYVTDMIAHPDGAVPQQLPGVPVAAAPQNGLRQDLALNDMRSWTPRMPMILCGSDQDHNAPWDVNTAVMASYWSAQVASGLVTILDANSAPTSADPYATEKVGYQQYEAQVIATYGLVASYRSVHGVVDYYCMQAVRDFFARF
ncbi:MAG TPA: prolyl oligopeptidase family serine peptidase [Steroidobacteraceae bacterium]|nr:prolyl oligopeptidase family serine peptidase [Steroidobacteraceae bacterium]